MLTHFSLCSGIGGLDLAAEWAGFKTVGQCEINDYANRVLEKNFPDVKRWRDVKDVNKKQLDIQQIKDVTVLSAGFPCQPHSISGKRQGSDDVRDLWTEIYRIICDIRPQWFVGENVPGLLSTDHGLYFGRLLAELDKIGYNVAWCCLGAYEAGAIHKRERLAIIAYTDGRRFESLDSLRKECNQYHEKCISFENQCECQSDLFLNAKRILDSPIREFYRNDDGISSGLDRLRCLGNAVVPQQFYPIFKTIYEIESQVSNIN